MLSTNQKKFVNSLKQKKFRQQHLCFVVEGIKMLEELLQSDYEIETIYATSSWINNNPEINCIEVSEKELNTISSLKSPNEVLSVVKMKEQQVIDVSSSLTIALDRVQDPGNLGNIIRTADWFCISTIICSEDSVDLYNPKVLQATMGSFFRVSVVYSNLVEFFTNNTKLIVYGALLDGENVYQKQLKKAGLILLMGNESQGISNELLPFITNKISIPKFGKAESLNVATATAIICSEYKRE